MRRTALALVVLCLLVVQPTPASVAVQSSDPSPSTDQYADEYGAVHTVYSSSTAPLGEIYYSNDRWLPIPVRLTYTEAMSLNPQVYLEHNFSVVYVSWMEESVDPENAGIYYMASNDNGTTWTTAVEIGNGNPSLVWDMTVVDDLLRGSHSNGTTLVEESVPSELFRMAQYIFLGRYAFDTRHGEPWMPQDLRIPAYPPEVDGYYVVQLNGLVSIEWPDLLIENGGEIVGHVGWLSCLMRMNATEAASVSALGFVRWIGIYHPAYRIHESLDAANGSVEVSVSLFPGENVSALHDAIESLGAFVNVTYQTDDEVVLAVWTNGSLVDDIARLNGVRKVSPDEEPVFGNSDVRWIIQSGDAVTKATPVHDRGIAGYRLGGRELVALVDYGADRYHETLADTPSYQKIVGYRYDWPAGVCGVQELDESGHGTAAAASIAGDAPTRDAYSSPSDNNRRDGAAFRAQLYIQDIVCHNDASGLDVIVTPNDRAYLYSDAYTNGARIHSSSWGQDSEDFEMVRLMDQYLSGHSDLTSVWLMGNRGEGLLCPWNEGRAKNVITVGATWNYPLENGMYSDSCRGSSGGDRPRLKPTLVAPGGRVWSAYTQNSLSPPTTCSPTDVVGSGNAKYGCFDGTSIATPHVAGAAAMVRQYFLEGFYPTGARTTADRLTPSAALIRATLIAGAREITGPETHITPYKGWYYPTLDQGWGRVTLDDALYFSGDTIKLGLADEREGIQSGVTDTYRFSVQSPATRLRIALVWTDPAAAEGVLVNDLNLALTSPLGTVYRGNYFSLVAPAQTRPGGSMDSDNNEEVVLLPSPALGEYLLKVTGTTTIGGRQPYAVVVTGGITNFRPTGRNHAKGYAGTEGHATDGSAVALYDIDGNGRLDAFHAMVDDVTNRLRYRIQWNLHEWGSTRTSPSGRTGWTEWRENRNVPWEVTGLGVALYDINGDGYLDAFFMLVADLAGADKYYYRLAWHLDPLGYFASWDDTNRLGSSTGTILSLGGGVAFGHLGGSSRIDVLMMIIDDTNPDQYVFRVGYDLSANGQSFGSVSDIQGRVSVGYSDARGGDVAIFDLDGDEYRDAVFVTGRSDGKFWTCRVALGYSYGFASWNSAQYVGSTLLTSARDVGIAVGAGPGTYPWSYNRDAANRPDFFFSATGWVSTGLFSGYNGLFYRPTFDMGTTGLFGD